MEKEIIIIIMLNKDGFNCTWLKMNFETSRLCMSNDNFSRLSPTIFLFYLTKTQ